MLIPRTPRTLALLRGALRQATWGLIAEHRLRLSNFGFCRGEAAAEPTKSMMLSFILPGVLSLQERVEEVEDDVWDPVTARREIPKIWSCQVGRTTIPGHINQCKQSQTLQPIHAFAPKRLVTGQKLSLHWLAPIFTLFTPELYSRPDCKSIHDGSIQSRLTPTHPT